MVRIDAAAATVGRRARSRRFLESDPANTRGEWKRLMGTAERLPFEAAGKSLLPEELSAEVLASLLADVRDALGFMPRAAVISTPALFELPQNHATTRAGRLAGLEEVVLIQEPIASAIAAGWRADQHDKRHAGWCSISAAARWTSRCSRPRTAACACVDHAGDNFLGGKDIDGALVDWAIGGAGRRGRAAPAGRSRERARAPARWRRLQGGLRAGQDRAVARASARRSRCPSPAIDGGGDRST